MNRMHEYEMKCFSKTLVFNPYLPKTHFWINLSSTTTQTLNIFCIKIKEHIILDGHNKITHINMYKVYQRVICVVCATSKNLNSLASTSTPACVSFSSLVQQLNDHQALNEISFLIILSMCEGNRLSDLTRDLHT